jgi:hypothetical protein
MSRYRAAEEDIDYNRLVIAAHEVGHLIALQAADVPITEVRVIGHRRTAEGYVLADVDKPRDDEQAHAVLVALFTGVAAGRLWCDRHGLTRLAGEDVDDRAAYRALRRRPLFRDAAHAEVVADARRLVRQQWARIERLAPVLADRGFLPPDAS